MKLTTKDDAEISVAARVAGEDIARGDFVAVTNEIMELPSYYWSYSGAMLPPEEPVRIRFTARNAGQPYKVLGVCLPFVYAKTHRGRLIVIDTRQKQLVRLDRECARTVWQKMKSPTREAAI